MNDLQRIETTGTLQNLAAEINAEHRAFVGTFRKTVEHGIRAGELLARAKAECGHGAWLPWLEENFEGAPRTAQEYMRLHNHRDEIRANTRGSAHLSMSGALKEIAAPSEATAPEPNKEEKEFPLASEDVETIRRIAGTFLKFWSDAEREAFERILSEPGQLEWHLRLELEVAEITLLAHQWAVDGFLMEDAAEEGHALISYRAPLGAPAEAKEKIIFVPIPATKAVDEDADLAECIRRGCWQLGLARLKAWRSVTNWFAKALAANPETDIELWEKRVAHNADWRQLDTATEFLTERALRAELKPARWVKEHGLKRGEFTQTLELAEWLVGDHAERVWTYLTGKSSTRAERHERWLSFEVSGDK